MASETLSNGRKLHVVMFPWLAFGHLIPFYDLSKAIAQKGHKVTFISTPRNISRLPELPHHLVSVINLLKIPLPKVDGLPENAEATMDVRPEDVEHLKLAYDSMEEELAHFLEKSGADTVICDFVPYWLPTLTRKLDISCFFFCIFNAWFLAFLGTTDALINGLDDRKRPVDFLAPPAWVTFETKVTYKLYEANWIVEAAKHNASGVSDTYRAGKVIAGSDAIIIRHCNEFEPKWLKLLEELHRKEVIPLGLMPPQMQLTLSHANEAWDTIRDWLSSKDRESVVYVALGSEAMLSPEQISELAHGLELSGLPFLWALRNPAGSTETHMVKLPDGFEERIKGQGLVWKNWAPQLKILSHDSVGAFLTHCGWSSIVEGLMFGRPLIMLPVFGDQGLNARVLADKQVGLEIARNEQDGSYTRSAVAQTVTKIMVEDEGQIFKEAARAAHAFWGDRELHGGYVTKFISYLENLQENNEE